MYECVYIFVQVDSLLNKPGPAPLSHHHSHAANQNNHSHGGDNHGHSHAGASHGHSHGK